jgi:tRNA-dihydrouridine synthase B
MAGYTTLPFRLLCRSRGAAVAVTEMVSAKGLVLGSGGTRPLLATCSRDDPLVVQIFGSEEEFIARAMDALLELGFTHFDLNAGCPVRKVVKTGAGSALLTDPDRLARLVRVMADKAAPGRVGVKLRPGWSAESPVYQDLGRSLAEAGAAWLGFHPRFGRQGFSGTADHSLTARLVRNTGLPVIASGDLFTARDGVRCLDATKAAAVMFARGALASPRVFQDFQDLLHGRDPAPRTGATAAEDILEHARLAHRMQGKEGIRVLRSVTPRYVKGLAGAGALRARLVGCDTLEEIRALAADIAALPPADKA